MRDDTTVFRWPVFDVYDIQQAKKPGEGKFSPHLLEDYAGKGHMYEPLTDASELFLKFSDLEMTPDSVLRFARHYGALGVANVVHEKGTSTLVSGESLTSWYQHVVDMRRAVQVWLLIKQKKSDQLKRMIQWVGMYWGRERVVFTDDRYISVIADARTKSARLDEFAPGNIIGPARYFLQDEVNAGLKGRVSPRLVWNHEHELTLYSVPGSLLGAMWLQFAHAIEGRREYRRCQECRTWFDSTDERGKPGRFCSDACKQKAWRKGQKSTRKPKRAKR